MSYKDENGQVISIDDMGSDVERSFVEHFRRFGQDDARENWKLLGAEMFDGAQPDDARVDQNIDETDMFDGADEDTIKAARAAYISGWEDFVEGLDGADLAAFEKFHGGSVLEDSK
jgi:hypothetical protein